VIFCPGVVRPGEICPGILRTKEKNSEFSWKKFNFFPKKIFVLEVSSSFLFVRKLLGFRVFEAGLAKEKLCPRHVLDKIFQDNPRMDSSRTKIRTTPLEQPSFFFKIKKNSSEPISQPY